MPKGARRPTGKGMVRARKREAEALALRVAGATYQQIGERVGLTLEGARQCVKRALERLDGEVAELAKELRQIEAERLDAMTLALWERARRGDIPSIDCVLRLQSRRARLLRLDLDAASIAAPTAEDPRRRLIVVEGGVVDEDGNE